MNEWVIIDLGYLSFYRYHAAKKWLGFRNDVEKIDPWTNEPQFKKTLLNKYEANLKSLIKGKKAFLVMESLDGKNWRKNLMNNYKGNRPKQTDIFTYLHDIAKDFLPLFAKTNDCTYLQIKEREADDIIALCVFAIKKKYINDKINIITSDMDFLQLVEENNNVKLFDANLKSKSDTKTLIGFSYLKKKIIYGDTSDNIEPIYKGKLSTKRKEALLEKIKDIDNLDNIDSTYFDTDEEFKKFKLNRKLIDFKMIPKTIFPKNII